MTSLAKRHFFIIGILTLSILFLVVLNIRQNNSPEFSENLEECKTIHYHDENSINLVFFSPEDEAQKYSDYLVNSEPFKEYHDEFNFFFIDSYKPDCELYKGIAIYCHSKELIKKAASCPYDYIVVLDEMDHQIRSSAYKNVMSINSQHPMSVFLHEFGHSFSNLAEEYTPAKIPRGSKNCQRDCSKFKGETNGCFEGCSKSHYYRSVENGVMRTLSTDDFGIYNDDLISTLIENSVPKDLQITGAVTKEDFESNEYIIAEFKLNKDIGRVELISEERAKGYAPKIGASGDYYYTVDGGPKKIHFSNMVHAEGPKSKKNLEMVGEVEEVNTFFLAIKDNLKKVRKVEIYDAQNNGRLGEARFSSGGNVLCQID